MSDKTFSTKSNAHRAAVKAGLEPEQFETFQADDGRWGYRDRNILDQVYGCSHADQQAEIEIPDVKLDEAAEAEAMMAVLDATDPSEHAATERDAQDATMAPDFEDDYELSPEAIARRQAERHSGRDRLEGVGALAPQEPAEAPDLVLAEGDAPEEPEEAASDPDEGRIDDDQQTTMGAAIETTIAAWVPTREPETVCIPAWYAPGRAFILCIEGDQFPQSAPHTWAMEFAKRAQRTVVVRDATTFEALASYDKNAGRVAKAAAKAPPKASNRPTREPVDPTVKPVINSPTNQVVTKLVDRIEAKRGDLDGLRGFRFKPSSTYYRKAWVYLQALMAEAEGGAAKAA